MPKKFAFQDLNEETIGSLAAHFRALGEVSRLKLLFAVGSGEKNVSQLIAATGLSQANVSKHLKILTDTGTLAHRRNGICVIYEVCANGRAGTDCSLSPALKAEYQTALRGHATPPA